jgi:RTX calcium-binding nonapeptide repeat (4 copies)
MISKEIAAVLALYAYTDGVNPRNLPSLPYEGWKRVEDLRLPAGTNGFAYVVFQNQTSGELVISYRGTDGASGMMGWDGGNNIGLYTGFAASQAQQAAAVYAKVLQLYGSDPAGSNISFTEHSLGGGLAGIMSAWFDRPSIVFDPAPFQNTAESGFAVNQVISSLGSFVPQALRNYIPANDFASRESSVTAYYAVGEFLQTGRTEANTVYGGALNPVAFGNRDVGGFAMHSQALLTAGILSDQFRQATVQVQAALPLIMSGKLYSQETKGLADKNFLLDLIRSEQQTPNGSKLDHFASDLNKLATNLAGLNRQAQDAIIAQGIEWYYWQSANYAGQKFLSVNNGVLQYTTAQGDGLTGALNKASTYTNLWTNSLIPQGAVQTSGLTRFDTSGYQQWNVVATSAGEQATALDATKSQLFIGNNGADTFTGGNQNDALLGGQGDDTYKFSGSFGKDTIIDADGQGKLVLGEQTLGIFKGAGKRGQYYFDLGAGQYAGLFIADDNTSSTKKTAYITQGTDPNNVITIRNFDEAAASSSAGNGYLGIKLDTSQKLALIAGDGKTLGADTANYWSDIDFTPENLSGKESSIYERGGKIFTISLAVAASAGDTLTLNLSGELADGMKAILGDSVVDANGAIITLTEGQTFASFSLVSETEITADQLGSISANYQTDSALGNSGAGSGTVSPISSNTWGLTLSDAGESDNTLSGDYNVQTLPQPFSPVTRLNADGQTITVVDIGQQYYVRAGSPNLFADPNGELVNDNALYGSTQRDKIEGLTGSDLLGGFTGNDTIDGGEGADMIGGGAGADHILGGAGDDYISSSADVNTNHQAYNSTDIWSNYGLPAGKEAVSSQALWGVYKDGADADATTIWSGMGNTRTDTAATEGDVIDAGAGNDNVIGSWAGDRIKGGSGQDKLDGLAGDDIIEGNEDDDELNGDGTVRTGKLNSVDAANHGQDFLDGGQGNDQVIGDGASDQLFGGDGDDKIWGDSGVKSSDSFVALQYHGDDSLRRIKATIKSIAPCAGIPSSNCRNSLKNRVARKHYKLHAKSGSRPINTCAKCYGKRSSSNTSPAHTQARVGGAA